MDDPNRIANKMILLKRIIEQGVVFKEEVQELGLILRKVVKGIATALVMMVVYGLVIEAANLLSGVTFALIFTLAFIYGLREIFKDDVRTVIWNYLQRGRPSFSRKLVDGVSRVVAYQKLWLDFIWPDEVPDFMIPLLRRRHRRADKIQIFYIIAVIPRRFQKVFAKVIKGFKSNWCLIYHHLRVTRARAGSVFSEQAGKISKTRLKNVTKWIWWFVCKMQKRRWRPAGIKLRWTVQALLI